MKSLLKKKRYTEDLEHRAIALSNRNAELKDKIRTLLARLQAMGIVTSPSVGPYPPVIPTTSPFQRSLPLSTPVSSCLPTDDCAPVLPEFSASAHPLTVQSAQSFSPSLTPQQDPSDALPPSALNHMLALGNSSSATSSSVVGLSQIPDPSFVLGADPIDTKISNAFDLHHMTCTQ